MNWDGDESETATNEGHGTIHHLGLIHIGGMTQEKAGSTREARERNESRSNPFIIGDSQQSKPSGNGLRGTFNTWSC